MLNARQNYKFFNMDCISGCQAHIKDNSIDLIITDPPYGIQGDQLHRHYNRKEEFVIDGYVEIPAEAYPDFSRNWIAQAERILRPGGSIYIVSGYTHLVHILNGLRTSSLRELNHIVWKYNFGVYTRTKYISSHYHVLFYVKPGQKHTFNTHCRFGPKESSETNRSLNYADREDVWIINREYKPGRRKNKNELPTQLLSKLIQYSSNPRDIVCDLFLGSFSTAKVALGLGRRAVGFEISTEAFAYQLGKVEQVEFGSLLPTLREPAGSANANQGKAWSKQERCDLQRRFLVLRSQGMTKKITIERLSDEFGRGYWSITKLLNAPRSPQDARQLELFPAGYGK
jgi:site-specific DNA-methyltransferase (adenine-specific)